MTTAILTDHEETWKYTNGSGCVRCSCMCEYADLVKKTHAKVFENRILRRIFGLKKDANGEWRRLHNEELHSLYRSPNIDRMIKSRSLRWAGRLARMEEGKSVFKILTGKKPLGRPRRK